MKIITIIITGMFIYLAAFSYGRVAPIEHTKLVWVFKDKHSAQLADIYGLNAEDIAQPVNLWRK